MGKQTMLFLIRGELTVGVTERHIDAIHALTRLTLPSQLPNAETIYNDSAG